MSYPLDLDEMDETKLIQEIERRKNARAAGLCDYCGRAPDTNTCKFPDRHRQPVDSRQGGDSVRLHCAHEGCDVVSSMRADRGVRDGQWHCAAHSESMDSQQEVIDKMDAVELSETLEDAYEHDNMANLPLSDWFYKLLREFYNQKHAGKSTPFGCFGDYWTDESRTQRLTGDQVVEIFKRKDQ